MHRINFDLSPTVSNALSAAEQALMSGDEDKLYEALKAVGVQNLQPQNKSWYLKQLLGERENKEQVGSRRVGLLSHFSFSQLLIVTSSCQASPGEPLTKDELQSGVDVANEVAAGYLKSKSVTRRLYVQSVLVVIVDPNFQPRCSAESGGTDQRGHQSRRAGEDRGGTDEPRRSAARGFPERSRSLPEGAGVSAAAEPGGEDTHLQPSSGLLRLGYR